MDEIAEIPVVVSGATGKLGNEVIRAVLSRPDMHLVAALGHARHLGEDIGELVCGETCGVPVSVDLPEAMELARGGVLVEVSVGSNVKTTVAEALKHDVACVVGASNVPRADEEALNSMAEEMGGHLLYAYNFALGAVLMMRFAAEAAKYFRWAEIIERHHERKRDAPSGTARRTAELMNRARAACGGFRSSADGEEVIKGCRGGNLGGIRIHSMRMPGVVAQQEVVFGGTEETFQIIHNSTGHGSFAPGVILAIQQVRKLKKVVNGLENIL